MTMPGQSSQNTRTRDYTDKFEFSVFINVLLFQGFVMKVLIAK